MPKNTSARQTSRKAGLASTAKKEASTRHGFDTDPASRHVAGASGKENRIRGAAGERAEKARDGKAAALRKLKAKRNA